MYLGIIAISHEHKKSSQMKTQLKPPSYYSTVVSFIIHATTAHDDWKIARIAKPRTFKSLIASVFKLENVT